MLLNRKKRQREEEQVGEKKEVFDFGSRMFILFKKSTCVLFSCQ